MITTQYMTSFTPEEMQLLIEQGKAKDERIAELEAALAAKTDWTSQVGERAAKLASRIAANDYEVQAMEALANELAAAQVRQGEGDGIRLD